MAAVHPSSVSNLGLVSKFLNGSVSNGLMKLPRSRTVFSAAFDVSKSVKFKNERGWSTNLKSEDSLSKRLGSDSVIWKISAAVTESLADADIVNKTEGAEETKETMMHEKFDWNAQWYPVAIAANLDRRVPFAAKIMGRDLVVWWDRNGKTWQVWDDKCPHRLAPLSEGRINEQGELQCSYHGWSFAPCSGDCTCIPQAPRDGNPVWKSKRACAAVYPSVEKEGIIWFWPDTRPEFKDITNSKPPPAIPTLSDPMFFDELASRDLPYGYEQLIENLMDPAHVPFAHHGLQGYRSMARPLSYKVEKMDKSGFVGMADRGPAVFTAPCIFTMDSVFQGPQAKEGEDKKMAKKLVLVFICIPVAPGQSKVIWAFRRNFAVWSNRLIPRWMTHIRQMLVLDSDMYLLHLAERKVDEAGSNRWHTACYVPTTSDAFVIAYRRWLRVYAGGAPDWGGRYSGHLPPTPPKEQLMDRYWSHVQSCRHCKAAMQFFEGAEVFFQALSVGLAAVLGAIALKPLPQLRSWSLPLVCAAVLASLASKWLAHFVKKTYHFHDYCHALVK